MTRILNQSDPLQEKAEATLFVAEEIENMNLTHSVLEGDSLTVIKALSKPRDPMDWTLAKTIESAVSLPFSSSRPSLRIEAKTFIFSYRNNRRDGEGLEEVEEAMAATFLCSWSSNLMHNSGKENLFCVCPRSLLGFGHKTLDQPTAKRSPGRQKKISHRFSVFALTESSKEPSKTEEKTPSWARADSDVPPPWAQDEAKGSASQQIFEIPFFVYLLASAVTAIAAIGSVFEYVNQRPVFGILNSDGIFYVPLLGFFAFTGIPVSAFLWLKSVQAANKEAEEQDRRDGFL
ncbi:hypothetical protein CJ030_MR2G007942 [Morella rubra]|uniref:Uncharacterized protein n=1 Tax=Morella rubra TaxID=262757 RepID=A0A6A1WMG4_9ROSI|nr:hypothetical protein CJ030_MR2G007942 [Morella rubra]